MASPSITSSGTPVFQTARRGDAEPRTVPDNAEARSNSSSEPQVILEQQVERQQQRQLDREGKELVNLRLFSDDLQVRQQVEGPLDQNEGGMKAVMVTRGRENAQDFQVSLLRVRPDGSTTTLFQSDTAARIRPESTGGGANLRGGLLNRLV